jgi:hypothetical protein
MTQEAKQSWHSMMVIAALLRISDPQKARNVGHDGGALSRKRFLRNSTWI